MVELVSATFEPHVGEPFEIVPAEGEPFSATLSRCTITGAGDPEPWIERTGRVPFSLLFHAPPGTDAPQQTFVLRHAKLGELALFMVPLGPDELGARYEAIIG